MDISSDMANTLAKEYALRTLEERRRRNAGKPPFDNSSLPAGSPMYYPCISCGALIEVPEEWLTRGKLCVECQGMKDLGWL